MSEQYILGTSGNAVGTKKYGVSVAIYSDDDNSLEFYNCQKAPEVGEEFCGKIVTYVYEDFDSIDEPSKTDVPWDEIRDDIKTICFDSSFSVVRPISTSFWFCYMSNCETIDLAHLNTSETTQMQQMFRSSPKLTSLDLSTMNMDKVERISNIMIDCPGLETLNICGWNTANILYMNAFVRECSSLKTIYADRDFVISDDLYNDANMFYACTSLVGGNGTSFDSSKVDSSMAHIDTADNPGYFTAI